VPDTLNNYEIAVQTGQEVRSLLPDATVLPYPELCPVAAHNIIKSSDLQALVRLIRVREEDFRQLEADRTHERFGGLRVVREATA
jgi:hypothetical protein